jgi:hypothetical protein
MEKKKFYMIVAVVAIVIICASILAYKSYADRPDYSEFEEAVKTMGIDVHKVYKDGDSLVVEYTPNIQDQFQAIGEIGNIVFNFADYREEYKTPRLYARVVDANGSLGGTWECKAEWYDNYREGTWTFNDVLWQCISTIEVTEG